MRTVLVTGASGGIGAAIARAFCAAGDRVALGCNSGWTRAQALCDNLRQAGGQAMVCRANVAESAQVGAMFAAVEEAFGPVEVLVNNAGIAQQKLFGDLTDADWRQMMAVHADGCFYCCRRALPAMLRQKRGCIVNVSSMWGQVGASCEVHYSAAKAAQIGLTKALAKELGPSGIRVNCVAPGVVETGMLAGLNLAERMQLAEEVPLGRFAMPEEIAAAVLFLASDAAAYMTGQVLAPNGGMVV